MGSYSRLGEYNKNTVCPLWHGLLEMDYVVEGFCPSANIGVGIDCLFPNKKYDVPAMERQREKIYCNVYNPEAPYLFEFTPLAAQYPYGPDYHWVDTEDSTDSYLNIDPTT